MDAQPLTPITESLTDLTVWEAKERAGLLALETDEWRENRLLAEDPDTTGNVLNGLIDRFNRFNRHVYEAHLSKEHLAKIALFGAIAAHPNTPADLLLFLARCTFCYDPFARFDPPLTHPFVRPLGRNPVASFVSLEVPDFWEQAEVGIGAQKQTETCRSLLQEPYVPRALVHVLTHHTRATVAQTARMHIAIAGEIQTEGERNEARREAHALLCNEVTHHDDGGDNGDDRNETKRLYQRGQSFRWRHRLLSALMLPLTTEAFAEDPWNRTPLDLMHHLASDGNRFVRWAAQTRLADPDFAFTWHEESDD